MELSYNDVTGHESTGSDEYSCSREASFLGLKLSFLDMHVSNVEFFLEVDDQVSVEPLVQLHCKVGEEKLDLVDVDEELQFEVIFAEVERKKELNQGKRGVDHHQVVR